jgi:3-hydroxybutyryl-CoA dehydrogenase
MKLTRIGIVGCGVMGSGIAQLCAQSSYQVVVSDIDECHLRKGLSAIERNLTKLLGKGKLSREEKDTILSHVKGTTSMADFEDCDFIIEAATEDLELKKEIFFRLDRICPEKIVIATNTSVLSVIDIAWSTRRPEDVVGMHFLTPAPVIKCLEVVRTLVVSDETIATAKAFGESLGKTVLIVKDLPGFVINRLQTGFLLTAVRMVEEGIASREEIDMAAKTGLGYPMGPLELLDLIGIDTVLRGAYSLYEDLKEPQYRPPILMKKMVAAGWVGRKTGRGFYKYRDEKGEMRK